MNIQDLDVQAFHDFREQGLALVTHPTVNDMMTMLLGEPGRIARTMYFDGNQETWAHRDSHYLDAEQIGRMVGVWIAAEDIHPGAGRFYVYAGSHRIPTPPELEIDEIDPNSQEYKRRLGDFAERSMLPRMVPELYQGDAIFWSSLTIHGSLPTSASDHSRRSFTAHYIPASQSYLWGRQDHGTGPTMVANGVEIVLHGNRPLGGLAAKARSARSYLRAHAPRLYQGLKTAKAGLASLHP
jgi:phytanoyl-CoA hydroxylase